MSHATRASWLLVACCLAALCIASLSPSSLQPAEAVQTKFLNRLRNAISTKVFRNCKMSLENESIPLSDGGSFPMIRNLLAVKAKMFARGKWARRFSLGCSRSDGVYVLSKLFDRAVATKGAGEDVFSKEGAVSVKDRKKYFRSIAKHAFDEPQPDCEESTSTNCSRDMDEYLTNVLGIRCVMQKFEICRGMTFDSSMTDYMLNESVPNEQRPESSVIPGGNLQPDLEVQQPDVE